MDRVPYLLCLRNLVRVRVENLLCRFTSVSVHFILLQPLYCLTRLTDTEKPETISEIETKMFFIP